MTMFWGKASAGLAVVLLATALAGCQMVQGATERLGCSAEVCTRDYPRPLFVDQPAGFDSLLILPPRYALFQRSLDGEESGYPLNTRQVEDAVLDRLESFAGSYTVTLLAPALNEQAQLDAASALHQDLWGAPRDPRQVVRETPLFGVPEIGDPVATETVAVPSALVALAQDACCLLVSRQSGWSDTRQARRAKVGIAMALSVVPGASGVPADGGDALTDVAVIRVADGRVLWSAQRLAAGQASDLAQASKSFFSRVNDGKLAAASAR